MISPTHPLSASEFRAHIAELGLTPYSAARYLGISTRQVMRYASGDAAVSPAVALLLASYRNHGLPTGAQARRPGRPSITKS